MKLKLPGFGAIKQWLLGLALSGLKKAFFHQQAPVYAGHAGRYIGQGLGRIIPGDYIDTFIASFAQGLAEGLANPDPEVKKSTNFISVDQALTKALEGLVKTGTAVKVEKDGLSVKTQIGL